MVCKKNRFWGMRAVAFNAVFSHERSLWMWPLAHAKCATAHQLRIHHGSVTIGRKSCGSHMLSFPTQPATIGGNLMFVIAKASLMCVGCGWCGQGDWWGVASPEDQSGVGLGDARWNCMDGARVWRRAVPFSPCHCMHFAHHSTARHVDPTQIKYSQA